MPSNFLFNRLLTPPETPLFHSLDDEEDQRIGMAHRGRTQIKPISISRSSTVSDYLMTEESLATVQGSREQIQRCFTLEEATDTILFCSSIAHDIAYKAATIRLEREQQSELDSVPRPTVTMVGQSISRGDCSLKPPNRRIPRHRKRSEGGNVTETAKMEAGTKDPVPVRPDPEFSRTSDSMKPPKVESKCNCAIM
nr:unnamed protein product [Digitaria exilis]